MPIPVPQPDPEPEPEGDGEWERVVAWRYVMLQAAGWPEDIALVIARRADIDLHQACELLLNGCSVKTAEDILL